MVFHLISRFIEARTTILKLGHLHPSPFCEDENMLNGDRCAIFITQMKVTAGATRW